MKNYQKLYYSSYFAQNKSGEYIPVTRRECFAPPEEFPDNPYLQRWFYDHEAGYAVRLARTTEGDALGKRNAADLKAEERRWKRDNQCIGMQDTRCPVDCDACPCADDCDRSEREDSGNGCTRKCDCCQHFERRIVELDRPCGADENGEEAFIEITDDIDVAEIATDSAVLELLLLAVEGLSPEERALYEATIIGDRTERDFAGQLGISHQAVGKQKKKLREKLRSLISP
jgi:DNA-binding CsgD family transcriptional regulator